VTIVLENASIPELRDTKKLVGLNVNAQYHFTFRSSFTTSSFPYKYLDHSIFENLDFSSPPPSIMMFSFKNLVVVLLFSSLASGDYARKCRRDDCLLTFERHHEQAEQYCAHHPNKFHMAPAPYWADDCHSLGRMNNMRMRLASACSCLNLPMSTMEVSSATTSILIQVISNFAFTGSSSIAEASSSTPVSATEVPTATNSISIQFTS
jgi:hypothetical protein